MLAQAKDEYALKVGKRIALARKELGMDQTELGDLVHLSQRSIQAYERGEIIPYRKLKELSDVLGRPMAWILHGDKAQVDISDVHAQLRQLLEGVEEIRHILKFLEPTRDGHH